MNHKDFFDSIADKWDTICHHDRNKITEILNLADIRQGNKILDVGTGTGIMIPYLASRVGHSGKVTAVDLSEKMIAIARSNYHDINVDFIVGDIFELAFTAEHYDVIVCYSVFPHFADKRIAVEKLGKCLKQSGKIVICHSQSREEINQVHKNASEAVSGDYLPDADTIKGYFSECGFHTIAEVDNERMFVLIGQKDKCFGEASGMTDE